MTQSKLPNNVIISCFLAGCLEMYDFVVFGFLATIIHENYLSFLDPQTGLIITYSLFAVGFVFRPIGSIIFGHIGDKYGRKKALVLSVSLMGSASIAMCLLPSYEVLGVYACYMIAMIRIIQGISVGGEYSGAIIFAIEHINKKNIGGVGATVIAGSTLGVLLATFVSKILQTPGLPEYSWRFAFLLGGGLSLIGYFVRKELKESPLFENNKNRLKQPLIHGFKFLKKEIIAGILLSGANNANFYFVLIFIPNYFKTNVPNAVGFNNLLLICLMFLFVPISGWVSDRVGRKKVLFSTCLLIAVYNLFFLDMLLLSNNSSASIIYTIISAVLMSLLVSSVNILVIEIFPVNCRFSCGAFSYSLGAALFGGSAPVVCSLIMTQTDKTIYIGSYIAVVSLLGAAAVLLLKTKNNHEQDGQHKVEMPMEDKQKLQKC